MQTKLVQALKGVMTAAVMGTLTACGSVGFNGVDFEINLDQNGDVALTVEGSLSSREEESQSPDEKDVQEVDDAVSKVKPILDLIGHAEGTDKGDGYDETLAYGAFTNGDVVLTAMTLAEIDQLQTTMLQHPKNNWNSSAVGRYQITRTTLRNLRDRLQLKDGERFSAGLQDQLAFELLKGRGFEDWQAGKLDDRQFARKLSMEWASFPDPLSGKSYYINQNAAINYAAVSTAMMRSRNK